jgi:HSP20 family protein
MNLLNPKWTDDWFPEWNPGYMIRPLHGDNLPSHFRIDVTEAEGAYRITAELPGVKKSDIDVQIDGSKVSISAELKQHDSQTKDDSVLRSERYSGLVSRSLELPHEIDKESSVARYEDGVLSLLLPKAENKENKQKLVIG